MTQISPEIIGHVHPPRPRFDFIRAFFVIVQLVVLFALFVVVFWLYFDDNPPAVISAETAQQQTVEPGAAFLVDVNLCKYTTAGATVALTWVDDLVFPQPPTKANTPPGCHTSQILVNVPANLPPAEYMIRADSIYSINPVQQRIVTFMIGPVLVVDPE